MYHVYTCVYIYVCLKEFASEFLLENHLCLEKYLDYPLVGGK